MVASTQNNNIPIGDMYMHALTLAVEAGISRYYKPDIEASAIQIITLLNQSMATAIEDAELAKVILERAFRQAEQLPNRGYGGYAQAIGEAMYINYLTPRGVTESIVLPELLRAYGTKAESRIAEIARKTGLVAIELPDDRTMRLFISWIEQQRVLFGLPDYIEGLHPQDFPAIIDDTLDAVLHFYPAPVFYDAIDLEQFLVPLLPHKTE